MATDPYPSLFHDPSSFFPYSSFLLSQEMPRGTFRTHHTLGTSTWVTLKGQSYDVVSKWLSRHSAAMKWTRYVGHFRSSVRMHDYRYEATKMHIRQFCISGEFESFWKIVSYFASIRLINSQQWYLYMQSSRYCKFISKIICKKNTICKFVSKISFS